MPVAHRAKLSVLALLLAVAAVDFIWMPAEFLSGDPHAWQEEARSLVLTGELNIPREAALTFGDPGQYFVRNERTGLYYSKYGIANSLLALPPFLLERALGRDIGKRLYAISLLPFNLWYLAFGVALAAVLYALTAPYSTRPAVRVLFVIAALYSTSLWFYQRGQSSEVYQVIFFTAFFMALMGFLRRLSRQGVAGLDAAAWRSLATAWIFVSLLVLTRLVYGLLLPIVVLLATWCAARGRPLRELRSGAVPLGAALLLPPLLIVALVGTINYVKFGAPWLTGYHQWMPASAWPVARFADGLWSYLFSPRFSVFLFFPPLIFALVGWRKFTEHHRLDAVVMLSLFLPFLLYFSKVPTSDWGYGPRYLLAMLPMLSLPALVFADELIDRAATWRARAWAAAALASLAYSGYLQVQVNLLPFWAYYNAREALFASRSLEAIDYFLYRHPALIAEDLVRHRYDLDSLPYFAEMKRSGSPDFVDLYRRKFGAMIQRGNLYWALPPGERR